MKEGTILSKTNLVDALPYIEKFATTLSLDMALPLGTNRVTRFPGYRPARGYGRDGFSVEIDGRFQFSFDVENLLVDYFVDKKFAMTVLWRAEQIKPLIRPSKITKEQALSMAREYLKKLGYIENELPLLSPKVNQWKWEPPGSGKAEMLPFFTVEWSWSKYTDWEYFKLEIDGLREKVTSFSTIYPRQDPPKSD